MQYSVAGKAQTGEERVRMALDLVPDLILMDIQFLKGMNGIAAAEKTREQADIPVIFLMDLGDEELIQRAGLKRPFSYVMKPCNPLELRASIEI
jgi:DNA-binding response OmpR family regulator